MLANLVSEYIDALHRGFTTGFAPDGTMVIGTPYRYINGEPVEFAAWQEAGRVYISDRGCLLEALSEAGTDPLENEAGLERIRLATRNHGVGLDEGMLIAPVHGDPGSAVQGLLQAVLDAQVVGYEERKQLAPDPVAYAGVREVLERHDARYRQRSEIGGGLGRRYAVDFRFAVAKRDQIAKAILIVATRHQTLAFSERWNFRLRDIHAKHPTVTRIVVIDAGVPWSDAADRTMKVECEGLFRARQDGEVADFVSEAV